MTLANSGAEALTRYVVQINQREDLRTQVLVRYRRAARKVSEIQLEAGRARAAYLKTQDAATNRAAVDAASRLQSAELHRDSLRNLYVTLSGGDLALNLLRVVAPADGATGDRKSVTERWGLTGLLGGLVLGILLAATRESVLRRRRAEELETTQPAEPVEAG
jgi:hypothetical protein